MSVMVEKEYVLEIVTHSNNHGLLESGNANHVLGLEGIEQTNVGVVEVVDTYDDDSTDLEEYYPQTYKVVVDTQSNNHFWLSTGSEGVVLGFNDPDSKVRAK